MTLKKLVISQNIPLLASVLFLLASIVLSASFGAAKINLSQVFTVITHWLTGAETVTDSNYLLSQIVLELRLPRIMLAIIAGAGLAISGYALQTVTRNPLADPYLIGISSGASFGAVLYLTVLVSSVIQTSIWSSVGLSTAAFIGAGISVVLVLALAGFGINRQIERMLLAGVAVSFMFSAMSSLLLYFAKAQAASAVLFWTLGSLTKASWETLWLPALIVCFALSMLLLFRRDISALLLGDETAHTLGINVARLRLGVLLLCSVVTATIVAHCGGIAFVGLMIPHTVRLLFPNQMSFLLVATLGASFLIWVDVLARTALATQELPVGIITAAIGSLFFLGILARKNKKR
ncbi:iron ABC transporter permease [Parashewanella spongiae]|uniref:Iron ABC transporter permease n=1 Tax=Parashewanella spongiae TaxID=342950 RepID=A0A3A6TQE1_9GAMM|nr:iron ABC transporter permease [Parashewanella spongiae]MCL1079794.1 iron ABC transporter permease [Parashewanella spongiae]RJY06815.1 iron ABC transporter permease [Parashewanella spongiae]